MRLYLEGENAEGKRIGLGSNEAITATLYEGNKKQYAITIDWGDIGDVIDNEGNDLPESQKTKGSTISTREWRNQPDERRKKAETWCDGECAMSTPTDEAGNCFVCGRAK